VTASSDMWHSKWNYVLTFFFELLISCQVISKYFYFILKAVRISTIWFVPCAFFINKQFRTCTNAFPNQFTVRSYEYCAGKHWILYWIQENKTATNYVLTFFFELLISCQVISKYFYFILKAVRIDFFYIKSCQYSMFYTYSIFF
jgi:hypothetical protein